MAVARLSSDRCGKKVSLGRVARGRWPARFGRTVGISVPHVTLMPATHGRLRGEAQLPLPWSEVRNARGGVLADWLQNVDEIGIDVDLV